MIDALVILAVFALPTALIYTLASISGWRTLAAKYPLSAMNEFSGKRVWFQSAQVGGTLLGGINNGLNILVTSEGMRFSVVIVGFAYRAFFVPWEDVEIAYQVRNDVGLRFRREPKTILRISSRSFDRIMAAAPRRMLDQSSDKIGHESADVT